MKFEDLTRINEAFSPVNGFFLVMNGYSENASLEDVLAEVNIVTLAQIIVGTGLNEFVRLRPVLYAPNQKDMAIADANARLQHKHTTAPQNAEDSI